MLRRILFFFLSLFISFQVFSQEVLPDFSLKKGAGNQKVIAWQNNFGDMLSVLTIQRSADSVRNFGSIYLEPNPSLAVNAFTDTKPVAGLDYYRIYYVLKNGSYYFTKAKKISTAYISEGLLSNLGAQHVIIKGDQDRTVPIAKFRVVVDSVLNRTSDSIFYIGDSTVNYKNYNPVQSMNTYTMQNLSPLSNYMFQNPDGSIVIRIPANDAYNYSMTIYQTDGNSVLYKIEHFENPEVILSKSSFMRAGFYPYELFENGKLKERSKFLVK